jgi:hypothetical protein
MLIGLEGAHGFRVSIFGLDQSGNPQGMKWLATGQNAQVDFTPLTRAKEDADGARRSASRLHATHARA